MMPHLPRCGIIRNVCAFVLLLVLDISRVAHVPPFSLTPALSHGERESRPLVLGGTGEHEVRP